jgi:Fe-S-cluster-containing hydrogenase component 2
VIHRSTPLQSLKNGDWFKLICGASFQDVPAIRGLTLAYALAGADCIDVAADPAVVAVARDAIAIAQQLSQGIHGSTVNGPPLLMASFSDGEDPHFRKVSLDSAFCPVDCARPCETICPTQAIQTCTSPTQAEAVPAPSPLHGIDLRVLEQRCYGCGRCLNVCPYEQITPYSRVVNLPDLLPGLIAQGVTAIEVHTQVGHHVEFRQLWKSLQPWLSQLQLVAISCPFQEGVIEYLQSLASSIGAFLGALPCPLVWQTDGRSMTGDIGKGTTHLTIRFAQMLLESGIPGHVQLAGGTNAHTVPKLQQLGLLRSQACAKADAIAPDSFVAGVAYGSYARRLLQSVLQELDVLECRLEEVPYLLDQAVAIASTLVSPLKSSVRDALPNSSLMSG